MSHPYYGGAKKYDSGNSGPYTYPKGDKNSVPMACHLDWYVY